MKTEKNIQSYSDFAKDETKTVNAKTLYPYECVNEAQKCYYKSLNDTTRLMVNKYWDNMKNFIGNGLYRCSTIIMYITCNFIGHVFKSERKFGFVIRNGSGVNNQIDLCSCEAMQSIQELLSCFKTNERAIIS